MAITGLVIWTKYLLWFHLSQTGNRKVTSSFLDFWMILEHTVMILMSTKKNIQKLKMIKLVIFKIRRIAKKWQNCTF